jgi:hypothetical protein
VRVTLYAKPHPSTLGTRLRNKLLDELDGDYLAAEPPSGPVSLHLRFIYRELAGGPSSGGYDLAALSHAVMEELAGIAYADARQVIRLHAAKESGHVDAIMVAW